MANLRQITLSPEARRLAEVVVEPVQRYPVRVEVRLTGKVEQDETRLGHITAWVPGRIDNLAVNFTGVQVQKGQPTASIYSPELIVAQTELIQSAAAAKIQEDRSDRTRLLAEQTEQAAREKLRRFGMTPEQIEQTVVSGTASEHIVLYAPLSGIVTEMNVRQGMYVDTGTRLFTISDFSSVWVVLRAYETDLPWIRLGQEVGFFAEALPGESFKGEVVFIDPQVDQETRTVGVRLNVDNNDLRLKPGMYVTAVQMVAGDTGEENEIPLVIPATAPLLTGRRAVVYVASPEEPGLYTGREVVLGPRAGDFYVVRTGLEEGELVVTRGSFKIDSAAQIKARPSMMTPEPGVGPAVHDHGDSIGAEVQAMEMAFAVPPVFAAQLPNLAKAFHTVHAALENGDLGPVRSSYDEFGHSLERVEASAIAGTEAGLLWNELAMLLRNDAYLGTTVDDLPEARRVFSTMEEHFTRLEAAFTAAPEPGIRREVEPGDEPEDPHAGH